MSLTLKSAKMQNLKDKINEIAEKEIKEEVEEAINERSESEESGKVRKLKVKK